VIVTHRYPATIDATAFLKSEEEAHAKNAKDANGAGFFFALLAALREEFFTKIGRRGSRKEH
jgi:hypothetical protein